MKTSLLAVLFLSSFASNAAEYLNYKFECEYNKYLYQGRDEAPEDWVGGGQKFTIAIKVKVAKDSNIFEDYDYKFEEGTGVLVSKKIGTCTLFDGEKYSASAGNHFYFMRVMPKNEYSPKCKLDDQISFGMPQGTEFTPKMEKFTVPRSGRTVFHTQPTWLDSRDATYYCTKVL